MASERSAQTTEAVMIKKNFITSNYSNSIVGATASTTSSMTGAFSSTKT